MKIYVDELPRKVAQRVIHFDDGKLNCVELMFDSNVEPKSIELLSTHDEEVRTDERKKVVRKIKEFCKIDKEHPFFAHEKFKHCEDFYNFLDQIEGEKK